MKAEIYSITYRIALTDAQQARLDRKWPDGDPFISYEKIDALLEPLQVENVYWNDHSGQYLYFTVYGDDRETTVAEVVERLEGKLGTA
ncbi:MAG: hypothetical protein A2076_12575 [Geobacteraceae bacterium GWC2_53_11]|nr:MAG: hypothetical protein A2076_12575 [Geobacteraceae bacterium GWC2_53_11]